MTNEQGLEAEVVHEMYMMYMIIRCDRKLPLAEVIHRALVEWDL